MKLQAFDFFCGAGGLTKGLSRSGIPVIAGFDCDARCRETYEHNNPEACFLDTEIQSVKLTDLQEYAGIESFENTLFAGCAPCQPFSTHRKGLDRGTDATLLSGFARIIVEAKPGFVLIENVPGIAKVQGYSTFRRFINSLKQCGYSYSFGNLNAKHFGVPQNRRRLVLIGILSGVATLPKETHGPGRLPLKTVREAISHFPPLLAGKADSKIPNHAAASISELNIERIRMTPHDGGDRRSWPVRLRLDCHTGNHDGHTDVYGRMKWDFPAPTLTSRCNSISNGRYGHPEQDRAISLREAAALQSFPDDYVYFGSNTHIAMQIGNAVPVLFAEALGRQIMQIQKNLDDEGVVKLKK